MKVKVQSGHSITLGRDHFLPGDICELEEAEAKRLLNAGVVAPLLNCDGGQQKEDQQSPSVSQVSSGVIDDIVSAIGTLPIDDGDLWTKGGKPQIAALEDVLQKQITAGDRDKAWQRYQEERG